jgi:hypothetical protein
MRVFENRAPRKIFGPKRDEVTGEWRKLHNEELNGLYSTLMKSRRMEWAEHVIRIGKTGGVQRFWWGNLRERDHLEDPDVDGRIY